MSKYTQTMTRLTPVLGLALLVGCAPDHPFGLAAVPPTAVSPIVNGTREPQAVPLTEGQVRAIGWLYSASRPSQPFCTATLIESNLVATAAHCTYGGGGGEIGFGVGQDPANPEALFISEGVFPSREADAALILLAEDATAGDLDITPIPVNRVAIDGSFVSRAAQAGGYGETYDASRSGRWFATVYIEEVLSGEIVVDGRGLQGICYGDSGSALISEDEAGEPVVLAVESWGDESCVDIDHMTRLDPIWYWIEPIIGGDYPEDPCADVPPEGRCVDNVAESCRRSTLRQTDCTQLETECTYISASERYGCGCGDLTEVGRCHGDTREYCRDGRVVQSSCSTREGHCGFDAVEGRYACVDTAVCRPEDEVGRCDGNALVRCALGRTSRQLCPADGRVCVETDQGATCEMIEEATDGGVETDASDEVKINAADDGEAGDEVGWMCGASASPPSQAGWWVVGLIVAITLRGRRRTRRY